MQLYYRFERFCVQIPSRCPPDLAAGQPGSRAAEQPGSLAAHLPVEAGGREAGGWGRGQGQGHAHAHMHAHARKHMHARQHTHEEESKGARRENNFFIHSPPPDRPPLRRPLLVIPMFGLPVLSLCTSQSSHHHMCQLPSPLTYNLRWVCQTGFS